MIAHVEMLLANRQPHEEKAAVRYTTLSQVVAEFTARMERIGQLEDRVARCTCDHAPGFELKDTDTPAYSAMRQAGIDRMLERAGLL